MIFIRVSPKSGMSHVFAAIDRESGAARFVCTPLAKNAQKRCIFAPDSPTAKMSRTSLLLHGFSQSPTSLTAVNGLHKAKSPLKPSFSFSMLLSC